MASTKSEQQKKTFTLDQLWEVICWIKHKTIRCFHTSWVPFIYPLIRGLTIWWSGPSATCGLIVSQLFIITATTLAQALITCHLDCCNSLLTGFFQNRPLLDLCLQRIPARWIHVPPPPHRSSPISSVCCSDRLLSHFYFTSGYHPGFVFFLFIDPSSSPFFLPP